MEDTASQGHQNRTAVNCCHSRQVHVQFEVFFCRILSQKLCEPFQGASPLRTRQTGNWCKGLLSRLYFPNSCFDAASFQRCTLTWTLILRRSFVHSDAALFTGVALLFLFPLYTYLAISEHCFSCKSVVTTLNLALTLWCVHISDLLFSVSSLGADHDIVSWMRSLTLISPALKCVAYVFTHAHA